MDTYQSGIQFYTQALTPTELAEVQSWPYPSVIIVRVSENNQVIAV